MKSSLWIVIVVVVGIVGFLMGYSVSAYTASRSAEAIRAKAGAVAEPSAGHEAVKEAAAPAAPAGYGAPAPAERPARPAAAYGAPAEKPAPAAAGYGR